MLIPEPGLGDAPDLDSRSDGLTDHSGLVTARDVDMEVYLHGFGSRPEEFRSHWAFGDDGRPRVFLEGGESDGYTSGRRWFPLTSRPGSKVSGLREAVAFAEHSIELAMQASNLSSSSPIALFGHSQGAMVSLAIADRGRFTVRSAQCFAGFLPAPFCGNRRGSAIKGGGALHLNLYFSTADAYINAADVLQTAAHFRAVHAARVEVWKSDRLSHTFSMQWLHPAHFVCLPEVV